MGKGPQGAGDTEGSLSVFTNLIPGWSVPHSTTQSRLHLGLPMLGLQVYIRPTNCCFISNGYLLSRLKSFQVRVSLELTTCLEACLSLTQLSVGRGLMRSHVLKPWGRQTPEQFTNITDTIFVTNAISGIKIVFVIAVGNGSGSNHWDPWTGSA